MSFKFLENCSYEKSVSLFLSTGQLNISLSVDTANGF